MSFYAKYLPSILRNHFTAHLQKTALMANQADLDRHELGIDTWNQWAEKNPGVAVDFSADNMINNFVGFIFPGDVNFSGSKFRGSVRFEDTEFHGNVNFTGANFPEEAVFNNAKFLGVADFTNAKFHSHCSFSQAVFLKFATFANAHFHGPTNFSGSRFESDVSAELAQFNHPTMFKAICVFGDLNLRGIVAEGDFDLSELQLIGNLNLQSAEFRRKFYLRAAEIGGSSVFHRTTISDEALFGGTCFKAHVDAGDMTFGSDAWFFETKFKEGVDYSQTEFRGRTNFDNSHFDKSANFNAIGSTGPFSLANAVFLDIPDFSQASFRASPRLDNIEVPQPATLKRLGNREVAARYRALKRLAIEGHDHLREQQFFTGEIVEQRGNDDNPLGPNAARFWFGYAYGLVSDFGRSIIRPLGWLGLSLLIFAAIAGTNVGTAARQACNWQSNWLLPEIYLSFLHSLPIVGFGRGEKRDQALACLFGDKANVSPAMDMLFIGQNIWSAILIFLFLLAVRNHFRIK